MDAGWAGCCLRLLWTVNREISSGGDLLLREAVRDNGWGHFAFVLSVVYSRLTGISLPNCAFWAAKSGLKATFWALFVALTCPFAAAQAPNSAFSGPFLHIPKLNLAAWLAAGLDPAAGPDLRPATPAELAMADGQEPAAPPPPTPQQTASQKKKRTYSKSATAGSPGHIFWIVPAYKVNYAGHFKPLTPHEKFQEWAQSAYDPLGLAATAVEGATLEYSSTDGFCGYGNGFGNYMKCFGSLELDANDSSFFGDFVFTVWWHQDPRYFRLGEGSFPRRVFYAISRVFVTYNDQGKNVFYSSALAGTAMASIISNTYYPKQDRGVSLTMSRVAIDLGNTALYNGAAEFWPDIHRWMQRRF